jgi:hypothetical protein
MFEMIVRLTMSFVLIWMGLNLLIGPRDYKAFAGNLKGPFFIRLFVGFPDWVMRGFGILPILVGVFFFASVISDWHRR